MNFGELPFRQAGNVLENAGDRSWRSCPVRSGGDPPTWRSLPRTPRPTWVIRGACQASRDLAV